MKMTEFRANKSKSLRAHSIDFSQTSESSFNIPGEDQFADEPFQFMVSVNEHGRVHGFLISNRFYIVWLDRNHNLYS